LGRGSASPPSIEPATGCLFPAPLPQLLAGDRRATAAPTTKKNKSMA
jgi:hypothetical protein